MYTFRFLALLTTKTIRKYLIRNILNIKIERWENTRNLCHRRDLHLSTGLENQTRLQFLFPRHGIAVISGQLLHLSCTDIRYESHTRGEKYSLTVHLNSVFTQKKNENGIYLNGNNFSFLIQKLTVRTNYILLQNICNILYHL